MASRDILRGGFQPEGKDAFIAAWCLAMCSGVGPFCGRFRGGRGSVLGGVLACFNPASLDRTLSAEDAKARIETWGKGGGIVVARFLQMLLSCCTGKIGYNEQ
jgi:hypothetical protein